MPLHYCSHRLIGDEYREENIQIDETEGMSELEREKGLEKARAALHFKKAQAMVQKLDKVRSAVLESDGHGVGRR